MDLGQQNWLSFLVLGGAALAASLYVTFGPEERESARARRARRLRRRGHPPGLPNRGNSCFVNAVLQALASVPAFREWLEEHREGFPEGGVGRAMDKVLAYLDGEERDEVSPALLLEALRRHGWYISRDEQDALEMLDVCFSSLEEELQRATRERDGCQSPLESSLMDSEDDDDDAAAASPDRTPPPSPSPSEPHTPCSAVSSVSSAALKRSSSGVFSRCASDLELSVDSIRRQVRRRGAVTPFCGTLASKVARVAATHVPADSAAVTRGSDGPKSSPVSSTAFNTVSLSLPKSTSPLFGALHAVTLETLLQMFVSKESVDDGRRVKQLTFGRLPKCLCLHIQRTTFQGGVTSKRSDGVILPQFLNMDLFSYTGQIFKEKMLSGKALLANRDEGEGGQQPPKSPQRRGPRACYYRLCSVIVHLGGGPRGGHYVTYRRTRQREKGSDDEGDGGPASAMARGVERWFMISDERVEEVDVTRVLRSEAYAVFYEKCPAFSGLLSA